MGDEERQRKAKDRFSADSWQKMQPEQEEEEELIYIGDEDEPITEQETAALASLNDSVSILGNTDNIQPGLLKRGFGYRDTAPMTGHESAVRLSV